MPTSGAYDSTAACTSRTSLAGSSPSSACPEAAADNNRESRVSQPLSKLMTADFLLCVVIPRAVPTATAPRPVSTACPCREIADPAAIGRRGAAEMILAALPDPLPLPEPEPLPSSSHADVVASACSPPNQPPTKPPRKPAAATTSRPAPPVNATPTAATPSPAPSSTPSEVCASWQRLESLGAMSNLLGPKVSISLASPANWLCAWLISSVYMPAASQPSDVLRMARSAQPEYFGRGVP